MFNFKRHIEVLKSNKDHIESSFYLFSINFLNFLFPILISPFIIRKAGLEGFGLVIMFQAVAIFISSLTDYGFNINATREITLNKEEVKFINQHFFTINYTKTILLFIAILIFIFCYFFLEKAHNYPFIYFTSIFILLGRAFNPLWILRAIHEMKKFFVFFIFFKFLSLFIIYYFLVGKENLFIVNLTIGFFDFLICFFSTIFLIVNKRWKLVKPNINLIKLEIITGFSIFIQVISINSSLYLNPIILGIYVDEFSLGIYCVVEKIISIVKFCASFVIQSVFPKACELSTESSVKLKLFSKNLFIFLTLSMIIAAIIITVFSKTLISFFDKTSIVAGSNLLLFCAWIPLIVSLNMVPYLTFMVYGKQKKLTNIMVVAAIISVLINNLLSKFFGVYGISTGIYITELFISVALWLFLSLKYSEYNFLKK